MSQSQEASFTTLARGELSVTGEDMSVIYIWFLPAELYLAPAY